MQWIVRALVLAACLAGSTAAAAAYPSVEAPAGHHFGPLKLTVVDIRRGLDDLTSRLGAHPGQATAVYSRALLVEDALHAWARAFPQDPWIPGCAFALAQLYREVGVGGASARKDGALDWLISAYPDSDYARMGRI